MHDQAQQLRHLVSRLTSSQRPSGQPARIVLSGCKGGVGTTTLAINLAVAAKQHFDRVLLLDADPVRGDLATMLRLRSPHDLDDALAGKCSLRQAMVAGPAGIQIVPRFGDRGPSTPRWQQLERQLAQISHRFDIVFMDGGCSPVAAERLWPLADRGIVVATPEAVAVVNAYALLKSLVRQHSLPPILNSIVNRANHETLACDVQRRLREACERFLRIHLEPLGTLEFDPRWLDASIAGRPIVASPSGTDSTIAIEAMVERIAAETAREHGSHGEHLAPRREGNYDTHTPAERSQTA